MIWLQEENLISLSEVCSEIQINYRKYKSNIILSGSSWITHCLNQPPKNIETCSEQCQRYMLHEMPTKGIHTFVYNHLLYMKGKSIPIQTWAGPEGARRLRLPDFKIISTQRWLGCQPYALATFTPQKIFQVLIYVK